jgi:hypothetical protein
MFVVATASIATNAPVQRRSDEAERQPRSGDSRFTLQDVVTISRWAARALPTGANVPGWRHDELAAMTAVRRVDGVPMEPGMVVYADRLQATGLTVNLACQISVPGETCTVTGNVLLKLFQRTKGAQTFTFFAGPLPPIVHRVVVKAQGLIECRTNANVIPCPSSTLDGYEDAQTMAAIGKATLIVEEQQNWGQQ